MQPFLKLSDASVEAINTVGQWLAQDDFHGETAYPADCVVLAGNAVIPTIDAACRIAHEQRIPLLISGGIGHSTTFLYAAIAQHPRYNTIRTTGRAEASILGDIARQFWQIPADKIWLDEHSTNCGENARFSAKIIAGAAEPINTAIVVQDPTMQRRTVATFRRVTRDDPDAPRWLSHPGFTPRLRQQEEGPALENAGEGVWSLERYLALVAGEIPRLRNDETGYGPCGRDFIVHVDFPPEVDAAWRILQQDAALNAVINHRSL
ncbi:YdcF family protein [Citrobacter rodentium]|jgi:Uncharacterized conserved protein|uniref:DUF218 domain-containing protein n=2 Tax=Citrobacter rodentium TaxID=67825 RepID=D2TJG9_CITRI|nr:YdcF family protein [Citrobacter rodentium]KIQ49605.1 hypothetical protein TA05_20125 [Citrobacter rodentium]QBY28206.1 YdcF family protein [Citrobacter rodentium]UHO29917.1 YdcF family protein [Citrobacter rodentium NBRC 105723 = DSM 16636]CBG88385.1 conserved hypothetical protein [Citrobacter rodentium ICC168]HAT8011585.1 YdcF family protein [Citrobacter rodentium NBRC 105723 = DSM 16636]